MKKIMMVMLCALMGIVAMADTVDVYKFKASINVPALSEGVRTYKTQKLEGKLFIRYSDTTNAIDSAYVVAENKKSKVTHYIDMSDGFYNLMGKSTKKVSRSTPTVWFVGADDEMDYSTNTVETHEFIKFVSLAGKGSLKSTKVTTTSCSVCGDSITTTEYCNKLNSISGNLNGVMICECPTDESWWHTVVAWFCGPAEGDEETIRVSEAAFWGSWSAKYKETLVED